MIDSTTHCCHPILMGLVNQRNEHVPGHDGIEQCVRRLHFSTGQQMGDFVAACEEGILPLRWYNLPEFVMISRNIYVILNNGYSPCLCGKRKNENRQITVAMIFVCMG